MGEALYGTALRQVPFVCILSSVVQIENPLVIGSPQRTIRNVPRIHIRAVHQHIDQLQTFCCSMGTAFALQFLQRITRIHQNVPKKRTNAFQQRQQRLRLFKGLSAGDRQAIAGVQRGAPADQIRQQRIVCLGAVFRLELR